MDISAAIVRKPSKNWLVPLSTSTDGRTGAGEASADVAAVVTAPPSVVKGEGDMVVLRDRGDVEQDPFLIVSLRKLLSVRLKRVEDLLSKAMIGGKGRDKLNFFFQKVGYLDIARS